MSHGASARLFVAIAAPAQVCAVLAAWGREAASALAVGGRPSREDGVRVLEPDSLHLTLLFLGSRPTGEIDALAAALRSTPATLGSLTVGPPLLLPSRRPRALALEVRDAGEELAALRDRLAGALGQSGSWTPERRRLRPHITVARLREGALSRRRAGTPIVLPPAPLLSFVPARVALYRSHLEPAGARYVELAACPPGRLGGEQ